MKTKLKKQIRSLAALALSLLTISGDAYSCIHGIESAEASSEKGFLYEVEPTEVCVNCETVAITAPTQYKKNLLIHLIFSTIVDGELKSTAYIPMLDDPNFPTFGVIIARDDNTKHELRIVYGNSHCPRYSFEMDFIS